MEFNAQCENVAGDISGWFALFHPSRGSEAGETPGIWLGKIVAAPLSIVGVAAHGLLQLRGRAGKAQMCCATNIADRPLNDPCRLSSDRARAIANTVASKPLRSHDMFIAPAIPEAVREAVVAAEDLQPGEEPVAVVLSQLFGRTVSGLAFTESGVYFRSLRTTEQSYVAYADLAEETPQKVDRRKLMVLGKTLELSRVDADDVAALLNGIVDSVRPR
jgi:hypothetical protein